MAQIKGISYLCKLLEFVLCWTTVGSIFILWLQPQAKSTCPHVSFFLEKQRDIYLEKQPNEELITGSYLAFA
jgi:hypothetical protein